MLLVVLHCGQYQQMPSDPAEDLRHSIMGTALILAFNVYACYTVTGIVASSPLPLR